jgi:hypothetical protein
MRVFHPRKVKFPETDDLLLYYYYYLDYNRKKEEEHKLQSWNECVKNVFQLENKLFTTLDDLTVSLAYTIEDEAKVQPIIKDLKKKKLLVSSGTILDGIGSNISKKPFFSKLVNKVMNSFNIGGSNVGELSKGLHCPLELVEVRAAELETQVIKTNMISERKIKDFLHCKYGYSEIEQELLLIHMKNNKMIEICQVTIKDETTEEESDHRVLFSVQNVDKNEQRNLKLLELEINLYTLSDAIQELESIQDTISSNVKEHVREGRETLVFDMLKYIVYAEEVWVNVARSITMIEEQLTAFREMSEITVKLLIRQSRRDIFFYEKCRNYLNSVVSEPIEPEVD